jgi:CheY-like chemotaxis protein
MSANGSRLLLILASRDRQSAAQLSEASSLNPAETGIELQRLIDRGFIIAADDAEGVVIYRLQPADVRPTALDPQERILVVEDDLVLRELVVSVLDDEGYAVIGTELPGDATALLGRVRFDLVITDGFSSKPEVELLEAQAVLEAAGATPVALFTAHRFELDEVRAAGFRDVIEKPFDLETFEQQVRTLLRG